MFWRFSVNNWISQAKRDPVNVCKQIAFFWRMPEMMNYEWIFNANQPFWIFNAKLFRIFYEEFRVKLEKIFFCVFSNEIGVNYLWKLITYWITTFQVCAFFSALLQNGLKHDSKARSIFDNTFSPSVQWQCYQNATFSISFKKHFEKSVWNKQIQY